MGSHHSHEAHMARVLKKRVDLDEWKKTCVTVHIHFYNQLGDRIWDMFKYPAEDIYILQKIAIPLFGKPMREDFQLDLTTEQKALVLQIRDKCVKHSIDESKIHMSVIFALVYVDDTYQTVFPIIRVMSSAGKTLEDIPENIFIDHMGRVYESWTKYKNENTLYKAWICVPRDGYYGSKNGYEFLDQSSRGKVVDVIDHYSNYANVATGLTMLGGIILTFFPLTAPVGAAVILGSTVAGAPNAIYGVGRGVKQLSDRYRHGQSLSLANSEARQYWLLTASSLLSLGPLAAENILAEALEVGAAVSRVTVTAINITTSTVTGLGIINSIYELSKKKNVTALDIYQLTTSIFFFSHSIVTSNTANGVINEVQKRQISNAENNPIPEQQVMHDALIQGSIEVLDYEKVTEMHSQPEFIRELESISNAEEFYSHFDIRNDGQLYIDSDLVIHPKAFVEITELNRSKILALSNHLRNNEVSLEEFNSQLRPFQKECRDRLERHRSEAENFLKKTFHVNNLSDIRIGDRQLDIINPVEIDRLDELVENYCHNGNEELMKLINIFAELLGVSNIAEYCATGQYIARKVDEEIAKRQKVDLYPLKKDDITQREYYVNEVAKEFIHNESWLNFMRNQFSELQNEIDAIKTGHTRFNNSMVAANHYDKYHLLPKVNANNNLSCEMYFNIAKDMVRGPISDIKWTQNDSVLKCFFYSEKYGATAIRYDNLANQTSVIATLTAANVEECRFIHPI